MLPAYAMRMARVGEQSGKLDDVLAALGDAYARETRVRRNLRQAVLYPAVLTLLMGAIIAVVVFCVMPVFSQVLRSLGSGLYATAEGVTQVGMVIGVVAMALVGRAHPRGDRRGGAFAHEAARARARRPSAAAFPSCGG